ncbi:MAG TPA: class IV adenylate cyclase [Phycisphaerae bacterium]|nr:class IV adenylate cyclase [Phycisphaerae bacterium]
MPVELESKLSVPSHDPVRERLRAAGAVPEGRVVETNRLFDNAEQALFHAGCGLRVRSAVPVDGAWRASAGGEAKSTFTFKGPQQKSGFKRREEIELPIENPEGLAALLAELGYTPWLVYEKRRESWTLGACKIELDEIPQLGRFVECEGPDDAAIREVLAALNLAAEPNIVHSYPALIAKHLGESAPRPLTLRFA